MSFLLDGWFKTDEDDINDLPQDLRDIYVNPWKVQQSTLYPDASTKSTEATMRKHIRRLTAVVVRSTLVALGHHFRGGNLNIHNLDLPNREPRRRRSHSRSVVPCVAVQRNMHWGATLANSYIGHESMSYEDFLSATCSFIGRHTQISNLNNKFKAGRTKMWTISSRNDDL